ncbi:MAG: hypothetical protein M3P27_13085 [Acidobacteriota bacterium]|nr:hypothetical protein [Acidobacteriota bacterium]
MNSSRVTTVFAVLLAACLAGQALVVHHLDALRPAATLEEVLYIPSAKVVKRLSLGYTGLLADIYWTRAVQYFGKKHRLESTRYDLLYPLLDITTTLDPHLTPAYLFGATFMAQAPPHGAGDPDKAIALLEKGIAADPNDWHLYFQLAFVYYLEKKDYAAAGRALQRAAEMPNGNPQLRAIAGTMLQFGGELETSRRLWTIVYENEKQAQIKKNAAAHLAAIQSDEVVIALERAVARFRKDRGRAPQSWNELYAAGYIPGVPVDPLGYPYKLEDGRVQLAYPEKVPFITKGLYEGQQPSIGPQGPVQ